MKYILFVLFIPFSFGHAFKSDRELSNEMRQVKVEAETCMLQLEVTLSSISNHLESSVDQTSEICFDIGQLATYIKLFDLAVDQAHDDLMLLPVEERIYFRLPLQRRDTLLGACGIVGDSEMPKGDFRELKRRIIGYEEIFSRILTNL